MKITCSKAKVSDALFLDYIMQISFENWSQVLCQSETSKQKLCLLASVPDGPSIDPPSQGQSIDHLLGGTQPFFTIQYALHELTVKLFMLFNKQIDCRVWFHLVTLEVQTSFLPFVKQAFFFQKKICFS